MTLNDALMLAVTFGSVICAATVTVLYRRVIRLKDAEIYRLGSVLKVDTTLINVLRRDNEKLSRALSPQ